MKKLLQRYVLTVSQRSTSKLLSVHTVQVMFSKNNFDSGEMIRLSLFLCHSAIFLTNKNRENFKKMSTFTFLAFLYNKGTKVFEIKPNFLTQKKCTWLTPSAFLFLCLFIFVIFALLFLLCRLYTLFLLWFFFLWWFLHTFWSPARNVANIKIICKFFAVGFFIGLLF